MNRVLRSCGVSVPRKAHYFRGVVASQTVPSAKCGGGIAILRGSSFLDYREFARPKLAALSCARVLRELRRPPQHRIYPEWMAPRYAWPDKFNRPRNPA